MFKFVVLACLVAVASASGIGHGLLGHGAVIGAPVVSHTVASPLGKDLI